MNNWVYNGINMKKIAELLRLGNKRLKILFLSTEEAPFAKVGGLGEVIFALPRALTRLGHDARVMMPLYGSIDKKKFGLAYVQKDLKIPTGPTGSKKLECNVCLYKPKNIGRDPVITYFLENREYYELRSNAYGYSDDRIRFALLSRGCLEFIKEQHDWTPDVIVCADWMSGYLPSYLKTEYADNKLLSGIATVFSIHNLSVQGTSRPERFIPEKERDSGKGSLPDLFSDELLNINSMRRGIMHADIVNTVSPTYAREITTEEYGCGLEQLLREKKDKLRGILNGIDYETNNPATDLLINTKFNAHNLEARSKNKIVFQKRMGLPPSKDRFLMGIVSRITRQKGFALLLPIIEPFLKATGAQLVVVGTGDPEIMDAFRALESKYKRQVVAYMQYDEHLSHEIFAACDVLLIPSKYEPSGLTQMEAMHYGAVPVARKTGGLADTIDDFFSGNDRGTGFLFEEMDPSELLIALTGAYANWRHPAEWKNLQKRIMEKDFSWPHSAAQYVALFNEAIKGNIVNRAKNRRS